MATLFMETTKIKPEKTAADISTLLGQAGAKKIMTEYKNREVVGLAFQIEVDGNEVPFMLPVRTEAIFKIFQDRRRTSFDKSQYAENDREKAGRVAWRQIYRWVLAQLALIETGMVKTEEVFLPYIQTGLQETLYQKLAGGGFTALEDMRGRGSGG